MQKQFDISLLKVAVLLLLTLAWAPVATGQEAASEEQSFAWNKLILPAPPGQDVQPGLAGAFSGISNNTLIIAGGANFPVSPPWEGGEKVWHDAIYVLAKKDSGYQWVSGTSALEKPAAYGVSLTTPQGLLCIGGTSGEAILSGIFLLQWDAAGKKVIQKNLGSLPASFEATGGALIGDRIYVTGISGKENRFITAPLAGLLQNAEISWETLPPCPGPPRRMASYAAQNNGEDMCLYLFSGRSKKDGEMILLTDAFSFNVKSRRWEEIAPVSVQDDKMTVMAAPAQAYGSGSIFIFSGDDGRLLLERYRLEQAIAKADGKKKDSLQAQLKDAFVNHPGFSNQILIYNTVTDNYNKIGSFSDNPPVVTHAVLWEDRVFLPSGEIQPGIRTPHVLVGTPVKQTGSFGTLNYVVLALYFVILLVIGVYFSFRQKSTDDYFRGGGRVPWWAAGLSLFGTALSAITFMAIPAKTFATDWSYFLYNMSILLATPVVVLFFIPFFRRLNVTTAYEYLEKRFNLVTRLFGSFSFILFQVGRIAIVIYLPAIALSLVTGIDIYFCILTMGIISMAYTMVGGIEAVIWTDVIQVIVLMGGALLSLVIIFSSMEEGFLPLLERAAAGDKFNILNFNLQLSAPTFWVVVFGGFFANLVTYSSDQSMVQRYLTTRDEKGAAKTSWTNALLVIPASLLFFGVGTALFLYYSEFPQKLDPFATGTDAIFPWYIISELPNGVSGLLIAGVFSAAMSTLSSSMNSISTAFTADFYQRFRPDTENSRQLTVARAATLVSGVLGTVFALWMATSDIVSLWDMFFKVLGLFTGGLGGLFLLGIISRNAHGKGAVIGLVVSSAFQYLIATYTDLHIFLYAATGLLTCVVTGHLASLLIRDCSNPEGKQLTIYNKLFRNKSDYEI